ncbi:hypothetical protein PBRA_009732 [Plasmodiophora brassicae]|uniref:Anticodon-binding domain-containing protein n=1 Tax=Plasmodiophora brassicae TaxID=37360 RepID=A0A0G4INA5_PLABS|nr:hypothetical protein PBRA_009732 [Plasmodiophora brassicae]
MIQKRNPYFERQLEHALNNHIPYIVLFGQDELDKGAVKVKDVVKRVEHVVPRDRLVEFLRAPACTSRVTHRGVQHPLRRVFIVMARDIGCA